jgi:hypothetical protein
MDKDKTIPPLSKASVSDSASRFIKNFFEDGNFYTNLEDFIYKVFDGEKEQIEELEHDTIFNCKSSKLEPILSLSAEWISERIDDDRFSENNNDGEIEKIFKVLENNIDYENINSLMPKLYYENHKDKFTITKQDLLDAVS